MIYQPQLMPDEVLMNRINETFYRVFLAVGRLQRDLIVEQQRVREAITQIEYEGRRETAELVAERKNLLMQAKHEVQKHE